MVKLKKRYSAVLMSISSLPSKYGIGCFGEEMEKFISFIKDAGFSALQVLPFNLPDFGNSPYGSCSAFAGNYLYIDPKRLYEMGYLTLDELVACEYNGSPYTVDYEFVLKTKKQMLKKAFDKAMPIIENDLQKFAEDNSWAVDYALFMSIKDKNNGACWQNWCEEERNYHIAFLNSQKHKDSVYFYLFEQYIFSLQYEAIKYYAEQLEIAIIGDIPIYVADDSVDVWKNPRLFSLNNDFSKKEVAGVPPDDFSKDGQLWGNPVYAWDEHKKDGFSWWLSRMERTLELYDVVRIDHFRGFASYYSISADALDAKNGVWKKGPGTQLFDLILKKFDKDRIIAEDLGTYSKDVAELLEATGIKGMRVVQFGFSGGDSTHLPHNYPQNSVAYVGTHDNNTLLGWIWDMNDAQRKYALDYCGFKGADWGEGGYYSQSCRAIIETVWKTRSSISVIPFQDLCGFGSDARMNIPGVPKDNWRYRTTSQTIEQIDIEYFKYINKLFYRT